MIKMSVKGLAKFMTASPANQRKVLRDYKRPDPEGHAQRIYYREARDAVVAYHREGHDNKWLFDMAKKLADQGDLMGGRGGKRLRHNARGLRGYARDYADRNLIVLPDLRFNLTVSGVRITIVPDLHVKERKLEKIIKLEFSKNPPDPTAVKIINQAMFDAASDAGLPVTSACVLVFDVPRGITHKGARMGSRMRGEIEAACHNIATLWPGI